jgi:acyl carrier protein
MTTSTEVRVSSLLAEICACDPATIRSDGKLRSYGLDSARTFELVVLVEDEFGIHFQPDAFDTLKSATVAELAAYVDGLR